MSFGVTVENDQQMADLIAKLSPQLFAQVKQLMDNKAVEVMERARELAPVRTGRLMASIHVEQVNSNDESGSEAFTPVAIIADTPYAMFVEGGTSRMQAEPFMLPALEEADREIAQELPRLLEANGLVPTDPASVPVDAGGSFFGSFFGGTFALLATGAAVAAGIGAATYKGPVAKPARKPRGTSAPRAHRVSGKPKSHRARRKKA